MTPESGRTGDQLAQPQCLARFQSAPKSPAHRPPQCRGNERCSPAWNDQVATERPADSSCACRSGLPSCAASSVFSTPMNPARQIQPNDAQSSHIGVSRRGATWPLCSGIGTDRLADEIFRARPTPLPLLALSIQTVPAAGSFSGSPWPAGGSYFHV